MKRPVLIALCLILLSPLGAVASEDQRSVNSTALTNTVSLDGKWTTPEEWMDGTEVKIDEVGYIRIKDTTTELYILVDFIADTQTDDGDYASVVLDTRNDGGSTPKSDDHQIRITWSTTYGLVYSIEYAYGTDQGWRSYKVPKGFEGASSIDASNDFYLSTPHLIYEFKLTKTIVADYANVAGIFIGAFDPRGITLWWPPSADQNDPNTYGDVVFAVPIPVPTTTTTTSSTSMITTTTPSLTPTPTPCMIATAAYGSSLAQEVVYMRYVRDDLIGSSRVGRELVEAWNAFYYFWSPTVANLIAGNDWVRSLFRILLIPLVGVTHLTAGTFTILTAINMDLASITAFTVAAVLSIEVYAVLPMAALATVLKKVHRSRRRR